MSTVTQQAILSNTNNQRYGYSFDSIYNTMLKPQIYGEYIKRYGKGVGLLEMAYLAGTTINLSGSSKTVWEEGSLTKLVELNGAIAVKDAGVDITFSLAAGDGTLHFTEGWLTGYTAPADNANCDKNPTIAVTCNDSPLDSISIAINAKTGTSLAYTLYQDEVLCSSYYCKKQVEYHYCSGALYNQLFSSCIPVGWISCSTTAQCGACTTGIIDQRSELLISQGCCPAALM